MPIVSVGVLKKEQRQIVDREPDHASVLCQAPLANEVVVAFAGFPAAVLAKIVELAVDFHPGLSSLLVEQVRWTPFLLGHDSALRSVEMAKPLGLAPHCWPRRFCGYS